MNRIKVGTRARFRHWPENQYLRITKIRIDLHSPYLVIEYTFFNYKKEAVFQHPGYTLRPDHIDTGEFIILSQAKRYPQRKA